MANNLDRYGNTSRIWGAQMRELNKLPDGYFITVSFVYGATGDTWSQSYGAYKAYKGTTANKGPTIATYTGEEGHHLASMAAAACRNHAIGLPISKPKRKNISTAKKLKYYRAGIRNNEEGVKVRWRNRLPPASSPAPTPASTPSCTPTSTPHQHSPVKKSCSGSMCNQTVRVTIAMGQGDEKVKTQIPLKNVAYHDVVRFVRALRSAPR